nr:MAG TPA: hypothetical protein [Crassvirales sp.]
MYLNYFTYLCRVIDGTIIHNVRAFKEKWDDWISCFHTTLVCENRSSFLLN